MLFLPIAPGEDKLLEKGCNPVPVKIVHSYNHPGWQMNSHSHTDHAEILYIAGGHGIYIVDNIPWYVGDGDLILFNSGVVHSLESGWNEPLDVWSCGIQGFRFRGLPENALLAKETSPVFHTEEDSAFIYGIFCELLRQQEESQIGSYEICCGLSVSLLLRCRQLAMAREQKNSHEKSNFVSDILNYLDSHYADHITMNTLAKEFHISPSHISHEMQRIYHISPIGYLIDRRIRQAQWELASTQLSLKEVALHVGYDNPNHFSNLFQERVGMKPLDFRRKYADESEA
ncbi:MAG: AraC family transcriptional regulator [Clostridiales bacterium]|nr:AraC family transcriptional regulator [Clostridiales bacterium]